MARKKQMKWVEPTTKVLASVGAVNWGLTALGWNAVESILGTGALTNTVYGAVAVSGVVVLWRMIQKAM